MKWTIKIRKRAGGFALGNLEKVHYNCWEFDLGWWYCIVYDKDEWKIIE